MLVKLILGLLWVGGYGFEKKIKILSWCLNVEMSIWNWLLMFGVRLVRKIKCSIDLKYGPGFVLLICNFAQMIIDYCDFVWICWCWFASKNYFVHKQEKTCKLNYFVKLKNMMWHGFIKLIGGKKKTCQKLKKESIIERLTVEIM